MSAGQLYTVDVRAFLHKGGDRYRARYVVTGEDPKDAERKLRYHLDLDQYSEFRVVRVTKVKPQVYRTWFRVDPNQPKDGFVERTKEGTRLRPHRSNQPSGLDAYAIGVAGALQAEGENHALRRLGAYLAQSGMRECGASPLFDGGIVLVEAVGAADSTTRAALDNLHTHYTLYQGGAPGLGGRS